MSNRLARVRELLRREISRCIDRDFEFPGVLVTIHDVDVTPDLKKAHVFVGVVGSEGSEASVLRQLNRKRGQIQNQVARRVVLKFTPRIEFRADHSVERGVRVVSILDSIVEEKPDVADVDEDDWFEDDAAPTTED